MHPPLDHGLSFEHFLVKIRSDLHTFSDKRIDKTRSRQNISCDRRVWKPEFQICLTLWRLQKAKQTSKLCEAFHKSWPMNFIRKKLHQSFLFFCQWFEHITNFMKSTFYLFRFLRNPLSKSRSWILFLLFSVFLCSVIFFCIGSGCFLSCSEGSFFCILFSEGGDFSVSLLWEFFSSARETGRAACSGWSARNRFHAIRNFHFNAPPWYDTSPFTREHSQENFSKANRFSHSPSPRTSPRYLTGTNRKIPANRISIPNITSNIQPMIFKINRSICIIWFYTLPSPDCFWLFKMNSLSLTSFVFWYTSCTISSVSSSAPSYPSARPTTNSPASSKICCFSNNTEKNSSGFCFPWANTIKIKILSKPFLFQALNNPFSRFFRERLYIQFSYKTPYSCSSVIPFMLVLFYW